MNAGYRVSSFHGRMNSLKTDAPPLVLWDIMRKWVSDDPQLGTASSYAFVAYVCFCLEVIIASVNFCTCMQQWCFIVFASNRATHKFKGMSSSLLLISPQISNNSRLTVEILTCRSPQKHYSGIIA